MFGKLASNLFRMDISEPLSPILATGIMLSIFWIDKF